MSGIFDQIINYSPPLIVSGTVNYKGTWDASANSPTLNASPAASTKGDYYVVSVAGTQFGITFAIGDWIISNGTAWEKVDLTDAVSSVFGRTGAVVGVSTDYSAVGITNTAIGASNPSTGAFTTVSASTPIAVASGGTGVSTSTGTTNVVLSNSPTIVTPVIAQINDANGNESLVLQALAAATDYIAIRNGKDTQDPPHIYSAGASTNVGMHLQPKGSGLVTISDGTVTDKQLRFSPAGSASSTSTILATSSTVSRTITLPDATGTLLYGGGPLGTPSSGTVTNLTGTASININGTVGGTTPAAGSFTTLSASGTVTLSSSTAEVIKSNNTGLTIINGGSASTGTAGSQVVVVGVSHATIPGQLLLDYGTGGSIKMRDSGGVTKAEVSSTGLAVTGALSATGNGTFSGNGATLTFSGTGSPTITATNSDLKITALAASADIIIDANRNQYQKINGSTIGLWASTGLAVTGALSATDNSSVTKSTNGITSFSVSNVSTGTSAFAAYYLTNSSGTNQANIGLTGGSYTSVVGWDVQNALNISNVTAGGISIAARSGSSSIRNYIGDGTAAITTVTSTGLGIGTASPARKLHVYGTGTVATLESSNTGVYLELKNTSGSAYIGSISGSNIYFETGGSTRAVIDSSGNLLVGTTSAISSGTSIVNLGSSRQVLTVKGDADASYTLGVWSATTSGDNLFSYFATEASITVRGAISYNRAGGLTVYGTTSDYRAKDISGPATNSGALIDAVPVYMGKMKGATQERPMFIAHETPAYAHTGEKDAVDAEGNPVYQQIDTSTLVPVLWAEIQSLRQRVAALESN
jgi:hypothetical protein